MRHVQRQLAVHRSCGVGEQWMMVMRVRLRHRTRRRRLVTQRRSDGRRGAHERARLVQRSRTWKGETVIERLEKRRGTRVTYRIYPPWIVCAASTSHPKAVHRSNSQDDDRTTAYRRRTDVDARCRARVAHSGWTLVGTHDRI